MKRNIFIVFLISSALFGVATRTSPISSASQRRTAAPSKFAKFTHKSHAGQVKSLIDKSKTIDLDCAYCHGDAVKDKLGKDQHDLTAIGYPSHKSGLAAQKTHTACTECHAFTGSAMPREMCSICHDRLTLNPKQMATNIRRFPNPAGGGASQFFDYYSHAEHVDFFEQYATGTPLAARIKFYDARQDAVANKGRDKTRYECAACHIRHDAPVTVAGISFASGVKMSAPGHPECFVCHFDEKLVTPPKPDKPNPKNTFATNCIGCHRDTARPARDGRPLKGSEPATLFFARQIINTELNPKNPAVKKPPLPFSHKTHDENVGKTVQDCLSCHTTGKTAVTRSDFYLEDRKTKEKQPLVTSCIECHKKEMQTKIEGQVTIESSKCNYCHALQTIRNLTAKGGALPPENHLRKPPPKPAPVPATAPPATSPVTTKPY